MADIPNRLMTYRQAAELLQVSERTVFTLIKRRQLKSARVGGSVRIDREDLEEFIRQAKEAEGVSDGA